MNEHRVTIAVESQHAEQAKGPSLASTDQRVRAIGAHRSRRGNQMLRKQALWAYLFIAPFCLLFLIFSIGPYIYSFVLSFDRYSGFGTAIPVGLHNYISILQYHVFWTELWNTIFYWLAHAIPLIPIAFLLAFLVRSKLIKGQSFWKPVIFLPRS